MASLLNKGKKYKRFVAAVYPKREEEGIVSANLSKLLFYAMTSPSKLQKIGEYLDARVEKDLRRRRYGFVEVSMRTLGELIKACHKDLGLFAGHALSAMRRVLDAQAARPELARLAVEAFTRFAEFQDDASSYDLEQFTEYFLRLADAGAPLESRVAGLRALEAYVTRAADLDPFLIKYVDAPGARLVPTLLEARPRT